MAADIGPRLLLDWGSVGRRVGGLRDRGRLTVTVGPQLQTFGATVWQSVVMAEWTTDQMRQRLRDDLMDFVSGSSWGGADSEACPGHRTLPFLGVSG